MSETVKINLIDQPKKRIRESIDAGGIEELAGSIREVGLINAITIKRVKKRYEIIAGDRRFLACKMLGLKQIEANIEKKTEVESEEIKLAENIIREDLNPIDIANALL
ncbi:putative chromosome-partitioning protein ParB [subsurface metagenome]